MKLPPHLVVAIGVVFVSLSAILIRSSDAPPLIIAAYRMGFASIMMAPLFFLERSRTRRSESVGTGGKATGSAVVPTRGRSILLSLVSGVLLAFHFATWISSLRYTSVASSTVIVTTNPMIVAVLALVVLKERISSRAMLFMLAGVTGSVLLVAGGFSVGGTAPLGDLLALIGAVTVSGYMLIGRVVRQTMSLTTYTFTVYTTCAAILFLLALIAGNRFAPYSTRNILLFLALAVFCTLLGHNLFNWALRFLKPTVVSTTILGEPVIASVLALVIFREVPTVFTIAGGIVILASIYLFLREESRTAIDTVVGRA